jgi:hypothetical protein
MRLLRQDPVVPGTPAALAAQPTRSSSIARTLRTAWWPRFLVTFGGAVVFAFAATQGWQGKFWEQDSRREPPGATWQRVATLTAVGLALGATSGGAAAGAGSGIHNCQPGGGPHAGSGLHPGGAVHPGVAEASWAAG